MAAAELKASLSYGGLFKKVSASDTSTSSPRPAYRWPFLQLTLARLLSVVRSLERSAPRSTAHWTPHSMLACVYHRCHSQYRMRVIGYVELCSERESRRSTNVCLMSCDESGIVLQQQDYNRIAMCNTTYQHGNTLSRTHTRFWSVSCSVVWLPVGGPSDCRLRALTATAAQSRSSSASTPPPCATCSQCAVTRLPSD